MFRGFQNRSVTYFLLAVVVVLPTACSKRLYTRMKRVAKIAANPQEVRPLPVPKTPKGTNEVPKVETNPVKDPTREYLGKATLTEALKKELVSQNMNPDMNCFQYIFSNSIESIEISTGPCPKDNKPAPWKDVTATIYFFTPDGSPLYDMYTVDPKDKEVQSVNLGLIMEDPTAPGSALIGSLCTGSYAGTDDKKGCRLDIQDDGIIHQLLITTKNAPSVKSTPDGSAPEDWKPSNP